MHLEIITPEKKIFAGEADSVQLPGLDGLFQVLDNHAPIISALAEGTIKVSLNNPEMTFDDVTGEIENDASNDKIIRVKIKGGVMELLNNNVIVLAE